MTKIVFLGTPDFVQPIRTTLAKHFTLVNSLQEADPDLIGADLVVVAAYGKILTEKQLTQPKYGCINVHPSLLPKYRGPSPIQQAILNGDKTSGITIIKMDEEVDHGPIIYQEQLELSDKDNFDTLSKKMFLRASEVLPKIIEDFVKGKIKPTAQDETRATYCERLTRESGYFELSSPPQPELLDRMIRAYYPWPGVWTKWNNKIIKFLPFVRHPERLARFASEARRAKDLPRMWDSNKPPEASLVFDGLRDSSSKTPQNDRFLIQMEGKKVIPLQDFLNGYPDFPVKSITLDKK